MRLTLWSLLALVFIMLQSNLTPAQGYDSFTRLARVDASSLSGLVGDPMVQSFDLSPDGKTVSLLVVAGSKVGAPLWLITQDLAAKAVTASTELGPSVFPSAGFSPQVVYSSDGRYLVVQDLRSIRVIESSSLKSVRTISPPSGGHSQNPLFVVGAGKRNIFACAFGGEEKFNPRFHTTPVEVAVVDISSGKYLGKWSAEDVPQSLSANGDLIAVSSSEPQQGVLPLNVFDINGQRLATLRGGFSFRETDPSKALGRVIGLFTGPRELLLTPDENTDQSGHHSGDSLQLVTLAGRQPQVQGNIKPRHYGPTGEIAVSSDSTTALAISWYLPAHFLAQEGPLPASTPELLVLDIGKSPDVEAALPIHSIGLKVAGWLENRRPRVSAGGSVIAVAQDSGVTILTRNPIPAQHP